MLDEHKKTHLTAKNYRNELILMSDCKENTPTTVTRHSKKNFHNITHVPKKPKSG